MQMNSPKLLTWVIAVIIGLLGILIHVDVMSVPALERAVRPFWLVSAGFGVLALGNVFKGL
ncbi:hypothetical protein [Pseudodesulfovibrio senegalensis]|jgi:hypothetical protein|uniref:Uncharacterized protein n=1 Tax=Pseudodesulfovibrio senegalensis TaxID=1721087 RepID=A0A6N6MZP3_9BACT|nr:hypothetical protein [Pseudodesulfovibrio senegalensis]KAB1441103.1 hypothetical protein F8A88_11765 [Pseudodesulfovibrio senegalensis]